MDCTDFLSILERPNEVPTKEEATPVSQNDDYVKIAGWSFNVKSTIFPVAKAEEVVKGWFLLRDKINNADSNKLFAAVYTSTVSEYQPASELCQFGESRYLQLDIDILILLRLCYWIYRCSTSKSFDIKLTEIKNKIKGVTRSAFKALTTEDFRIKMQKLRETIQDCSSEAMFTALCRDENIDVSFDGKHDLTIKGIAAEVKTIHDKITVRLANQENLNLQIRVPTNRGSSNKKQDLIKGILRSKWADHIGKAIEQGGRIVFINSTFTSVSQDLNALELIGRSSTAFHNLLERSIRLAKIPEKSHLPVIIAVGAIYYSYHQSYYMFSAPVKLLLDLQKFNVNGLPSSTKFEI